MILLYQKYSRLERQHQSNLSVYILYSWLLKHLYKVALATCETSQVLLAGVSGGFSRGSPVFAPPTDWPVSYELK